MAAMANNLFGNKHMVTCQTLKRLCTFPHPPSIDQSIRLSLQPTLQPYVLLSCLHPQSMALVVGLLALDRSRSQIWQQLRCSFDMRHISHPASLNGTTFISKTSLGSSLPWSNLRWTPIPEATPKYSDHRLIFSFKVEDTSGQTLRNKLQKRVFDRACWRSHKFGA